MPTGTDIIGRATELASIDAFFDDLPRGPAAAVIVGEPGVGKSTIWNVGVDRARQRNYRILASRATGAEARLSFTALGDLIEPVVDDAHTILQTPQRRALRAALLLEEPGSQPSDARAVGLAVRGVLQVLAAATPVILALDDMQWLDEPSARAIEYAVRRLESESVGLLGTVRRDEMLRGQLRLDRILPNERINEIWVQPLDIAMLHELIQTRLGGTLSRPMLQRIHDASGGIPFYALEIARDILARPDARWDQLKLPHTLADVVLSRLSGVSERAREVLLAAAAMAEPTIALLSLATGGAPGLDEAVGAGLLTVDGDKVVFSHPLFAASIYGQAGPNERHKLHARLADVSYDVEERARHLALAAEVPSEEVATVLRAAAEQAARRGAPSVAAELVEKALELSEEPSARPGRSFEAARYHATAGNLTRARRILDVIVAEASTGDERADALLLLADTKGNQREAIEECERALTETADPARLARIHRLLGALFVVHAEVDRGIRHLETAVGYAERLGDPALLTLCLVDLARNTFWLGRPMRGVLERALALEPHVSGLPPRDSPSTELGLEYLCLDRLDDARPLLERELDRAAAVGDDESRTFLLTKLGEVEYRAGRWRRARNLADEALQASQQAGLDQQGPMALWLKAVIDGRAGRLDAARSAAEQGAQLAGDLGDSSLRNGNLAALGYIELCHGDPRTASARFISYREWLPALDWAEPAVYDVWPDAIEASIAAGDLDEAAGELRHFESRVDRYVGPWAAARAARCRGILRAAVGDIDGATAALERAVELHERETGRFEQGRSLVALGVVYRRAKRKRAAREAIERAVEIFEEVGAAAWLERGGEELARVGGRTPAGPGLSETERRVAELVAQGRTNREVATALFVTERTVEWNLSKIYGKLGLRSRAELARQFHAAEDAEPR